MSTLCNKMSHLNEEWLEQLHDEFDKDYMVSLAQHVAHDRTLETPVYPPGKLVFNALQHTPFSKVKVVIMGQDPYHGPNQAHGLSFSVPHGTAIPPSLRNIYKELHTDLGISPASHGELSSWAKQGVLLLNATLTVKEGQAKSHHGLGWERFTDAIVAKLCARSKPVIFVLWGRSAREKCEKIIKPTEATQHIIFSAPHPSPLSAYAGFFACRHFSKTNNSLIQNGETPIDWSLPEN